MMPGLQSHSPDQDEDQTRRWLRRLALLVLILLGSLGCMLLSAHIALLGLRPDPLQRDVRSHVPVDYGAGERRAAPLDPKVIEAIKQEVQVTRPTRDVQVIPVVPIAEIPTGLPTAIVRITPTASATPGVTPAPVASATATASPTAGAPPAPTASATPTLTPSTTPAPMVSATATPMSTAGATPTTIAIPTLTASATSTASASAIPTPTAGAVPTTIPPPSATATSELPPRPSVTATATPSQTPSPTPTDTATPTPTETPTFTPVPPPVVLSINPNEATQDSGNIGVTITGQDFVDPLAWLGQNIIISIGSFADTIINGTLSTNIPAGIYALTVENSDGQQGVLQHAFTIHPRPNSTNTLDSDVAFVTTFGPDAPPTEGDHDHVQVIFFEVPDTAPDDLYVRIFDADTGDTHDKADNPFNTVMTYTLRGGSGAYTNLDARSHEPGMAGINSGTVITQQAIGVNTTLDDAWLTLPISRAQGELVGGARMFKLVVQGASGDDGNWYQVALSTAPDNNLAVPGARMFAFSWCVVLPSPNDEVALYPFVPVGVATVTQVNFDLDVSPGAEISLITPLRNFPVIGLSGNGDSASENFVPFTGERATTWTAHYVSGNNPPADNDFSLWFFGDGTPLAVFTAPTLISPP